MFFHKFVSSLRAAFALSALPLTLITVLPTSAKAASLNFDQIYAFGDSLSDNGNVYEATKSLPAPNFPFPPSPYFEGRFSNGPVWVEQLANRLGVTLSDYAFGGATTGSDNTLNTSFGPPLPVTLPGLQQEIDDFTATNQSADPNALYIVWAGANDYLPTTSTFTPSTNPATSIKNISQAVSSLEGVGAKEILVVNLPDLGKIPLTLGSPLSAPLSTLTNVHNSSLAEALNDLRQTSAPGTNLTLFDINSLFKDVFANPTQFSLTNLTSPCLNKQAGSVCSNPNEYFFWDVQHPTTTVHKIIANAVYSELSVPEPSDALEILAIGALGGVSVLKRQQKKPTQLKSEILSK